MKLKKAILAIISMVLILPCFFVFFYYNVEGKEEIYFKSWDANDMPIGIITEYEGFEFIPSPNAGDDPKDYVAVEQGGRKFGDFYNDLLREKRFSRNVKTNGSANVFSTTSKDYVPKGRYIKFKTEKPCIITFYAYAASKDAAKVPTVLSRKGEIIEEFTFEHARLKEYKAYLPQADTYYIYNTGGSLSFCSMQLSELIPGDINGDGELSSEDIITMNQILFDFYEPNDWQKINADIDKDGAIIEKDRDLLLNKIKSQGGYDPQYFSKKTWNANDMPLGVIDNYDGLDVIQHQENDKVIINPSMKNFNNINFTKCIKTNGFVKIDTDYKNVIVGRAIRIRTDAPCTLTIYMESGSTTETNTKARVSSRNVDFNEEMVLSRNIQEYKIELPKPDNYYIYSTIGGLNVYYMELEPSITLGDLNLDGKFDYKDIELMHKYQRGEVTFSATQKLAADMNEDGKIDNSDRQLLIALVQKSYVPLYKDVIRFSPKDYPLGEIFVSDGIELIPAKNATDKQNSIVSTSKKYEGGNFFEALLLQGDGNAANNVPKVRSVKINVNKPSMLTFYAYSGSSSIAEQDAVISSSSGQRLEAFSMKSGFEEDYAVKKCMAYLDKAGVYYIYSSSGAMGICDIKVENTSLVKGDLNFDGKIQFNDLKMLDYYLEGILSLTNWQIKQADLNGNGSVDYNDRKLLLEILSKDPNFNTSHFSDKVWSMSELLKDKISNQGVSRIPIEEKMYIDGLELIPSSFKGSMAITRSSGTYRGETPSKSFNRAIYINGETTDLKDYVPKAKTIKFSTSKPCNLTMYVSSNSTRSSTSVCISRKGELVAKIPYINENHNTIIDKVTTFLPIADDYYIYAGENDGEIFIYEIVLESNDVEAKQDKKVINTTAGKNYSYYLTTQDVSTGKDGAIYRLVYDSNALELTELGLGEMEKYNTKLKISQDIQIVSYTPGDVRFKVKDTFAGWSGVLTGVNFNALKSGETEVTLKL